MEKNIGIRNLQEKLENSIFAKEIWNLTLLWILLGVNIEHSSKRILTFSRVREKCKAVKSKGVKNLQEKLENSIFGKENLKFDLALDITRNKYRTLF